MSIKSSRFFISSQKISQCPKPDLPEYAFIGRSNVGKSSLINMLTNHKDLAKTSSTPGKTKLINHFIINESWYLVDLPGYGYAKLSKSIKEKWHKMIEDYLSHRENLMSVFVLIDSRLEPQKIDLKFVEWLGANQIPFSIVFTKADKSKASEVNQNVNTFKQELLKQWEELPECFLTSSKTAMGKDDIVNYIESTFSLFNS